MKAIDILREADPKSFLKNNPQHGISRAERPVDRNKDMAFHFLFGSPIAMSFDVVAKDMSEAVVLANSHLDLTLGRARGVELNDERDTMFSLDENVPELRLTEHNCLMWWYLSEDDEDPTMNPSFTP